MKLSIALVLFALMIRTAPLLAAGDAKAGKAVYDTKCKLCHGAAGEGNAAVAKTLKAEFKPLGSQPVQAKSDDEMKKQISQGGGKMKAITGLSAKDIENVTAFVRGLAKT